ncbi:MAG: MFS transporter, partial [Actinomycetota bacterium]
MAERTRQPVPAGFWTIWTTVALDLVGFGVVVPILGRYAERFGANGLQVGLLFASFSLAQMVFAPVLGRVSDRIGRKPVIVLSLVGTAIGCFVTGAAGALWVLQSRTSRRREVHRRARHP